MPEDAGQIQVSEDTSQLQVELPDGQTGPICCNSLCKLEHVIVIVSSVGGTKETPAQTRNYYYDPDSLLNYWSHDDYKRLGCCAEVGNMRFNALSLSNMYWFERGNQTADSLESLLKNKQHKSRETFKNFQDCIDRLREKKIQALRQIARPNHSLREVSLYSIAYFLLCTASRLVVTLPWSMTLLNASYFEATETFTAMLPCGVGHACGGGELPNSMERYSAYTNKLGVLLPMMTMVALSLITVALPERLDSLRKFMCGGIKLMMTILTTFVLLDFIDTRATFDANHVGTNEEPGPLYDCIGQQGNIDYDCVGYHQPWCWRLFITPKNSTLNYLKPMGITALFLILDYVLDEKGVYDRVTFFFMDQLYRLQQVMCRTESTRPEADERSALLAITT